MIIFRSKNRTFAATIIALLMIAPSFALAAPITNLLLRPFGGKVTSITYCPCSLNFLIAIGPPLGGLFIYEPISTILHDYKMILRPGAWTVGNASAGGVCRTSYYCTPIPAMGTIKRVGTSGLGGFVPVSRAGEGSSDFVPVTVIRAK